MCCIKCIHYNGCKKQKKTDSDCCDKCHAYDLCSLVLADVTTKDLDTVGDGESDLYIFDEDVI